MIYVPHRYQNITHVYIYMYAYSNITYYNIALFAWQTLPMPHTHMTTQITYTICIPCISDKTSCKTMQNSTPYQNISEEATPHIATQDNDA